MLVGTTKQGAPPEPVAEYDMNSGTLAPLGGSRAAPILGTELGSFPQALPVWPRPYHFFGLKRPIMLVLFN